MSADSESEAPVAFSLRASTWTTTNLLIGISFLLIWRSIEFIDRGTLKSLPTWLFWTMMGIVPGLFILVFPLVTRREGPPSDFRYLSARRLLTEAGLAIPLSIACLVAIWLIQYVTLQLWPNVRFDSGPVSRINSSAEWAFVYALAVASMTYGPIAEEIFFRGFLFNALSQRLPLIAATAISSLIFGFFHASHVAQAILISLFGVVLSCIYHWRQTLVTPIFVHAFYNIVATSAFLFTAAAHQDAAYLGIDAKPTGPCVITEVRPQTPAEDVGIRVGDTLIRFGNQPIAGFQDLLDTIRHYRPGEKVSVTATRNQGGLSHDVEFQVTLTTRRAASKRLDAMRNQR